MSAFTQTESRFSEGDYACFREYLEQACGILLSDNKGYLVDSRLRHLIKDNNIESLRQLVTMAKSATGKQLRQAIINAMSTNETFWFRDTHPFDYFATQIVPSLLAKKGQVKVWCAACSTGQEPYSLAIRADEEKPGSIKNIKILATDISSRVIDQAKSGEYDGVSLRRGLGEHRLKKYFTQVSSDSWKVNDHIKSIVDFRQLNLVSDHFASGFDVIFCRNVLIYFCPELQQKIITRLHQSISPGGFLFLGGTETVRGASELFETKYYTPGMVYIKK